MYLQMIKPLKQSGPLNNLGYRDYYVFTLVVTTPETIGTLSKVFVPR